MNDQDKSKEQLIAELVELRQRAAEEDELQGLRRAAALLRVAPLGIHECDTEGRITTVNPSHEAITGYTAEELVGTYMWDRMVPGPEKDALCAYFKHVVAVQPAPEPYFAKKITKRGELVDVRFDWNYLRNPQGELTGFVSIVTDITAERTAQAALRQSEERFRRIFEEGPLGIALLNPDLSIEQVNPQFCDLLGRSEQEIMDQGLAAISHPDDYRIDARLTGSLLRGEIPSYTMQKRYLRKDGQQIWGQLTVSLLHDAEGRPTHFIGMVEDITEQQRAEAALRASEVKYRRLHQSMMDAFVRVDMNGRIQEFNDAYREMLGYESDELLPLTYMDLTPQKWHAVEARIIQEQILRQGYSSTYEKEYRRKDGTVFPVELRTFLLSDDDGKPESMWAIVRNITDRKQAEAQLQQAHNVLEQRVKERTIELTEANERLQAEVEQRRRTEQELAIFRRFAEASGQGFAMADLQGNITYMNPTLLGWAGEKTPEDCIGKPLSDYAPADYTQRREQEILPTMLRSGYWQGEQTITLRDGRTVPAIFTVFPVLDDSGNLLRTAAVITDITDIKQAEERLLAEQRALRRMVVAGDQERRLITYELHDGVAQQLMGAMIYLQSHELAVGAMSPEAETPFREGMAALHRAASEVRRLMNQLRTPVLDKFGLAEAIEDIAAQLRLVPGTPEIECRHDVQFKRLEPTLENSLFRIAQEAMTNACRHSKSGRIHVELCQESGDVTLEVRDWGIGFDPKTVEENRFGLEGIRERARILGGKLSIASRLGGGTVVCVQFPVVEAAEP